MVNAMKLWGFGKLSKNKSDDRHSETIEPKLPLESSGVISESDYKCLWILGCVTFTQVLPRTDLNLCVNEHGELALMALPDLAVSMTLGKVRREHTNSTVVLIQQIQQGKDKSYLAPVTYTDKQASSLREITSYFNRGELSQVLKKHDWQKIMSEVKANNFDYLSDASYWQKVSRIKIRDNVNPKEPDEFQTLSGYDREIPVFLYTELGVEREISRQELRREMLVRQQFSENNIDTVRSTVRWLPGWEHLHENDAFVHVVNRVETELRLNWHKLRAPRPSLADVLLNPKMSEFISGPPPELKFTPVGTKALEKLAKSPTELAHSVGNWDEPNIAHVALHVSRFKGQSLKDSVTSPAVTIFRDEMGIHALPAHLFRRRVQFRTGFSLPGREPVFLDKVPIPQIPEISWKLISGEATSEWWQTDAIAKKVLWLATYNLVSHLVGNPEEVVCSVTPIGNDVIQIAILFDNLEAGAPYAFAIVRDDLAVKAIPIFPVGTYEFESDGAMVTRKSVFLKNYAITRKGERIQSTEQIVQFIKPIYATVISGECKEPKIYEVGRP